jgi:uncharacterized membrane protein YkvA (DUF1232 family)
VKVSFELSPRDLRYFRERLKSARAGDGAPDEDSVIQQATQLVEDAVKVDPPEFVRVRLLKLEQLAEMLRDAEWRLEGRDRARILDALVYFVDPDDMIPDRLPGIGYLDDAIMIELVVEELKHDIKAYEDFCAYRKSPSKRESGHLLESRRDNLQARMRRRRRREREVARERPRASRSPLRLW